MIEAKAYRTKDVVMILASAIIWTICSALFTRYLGAQLSYVAMILVAMSIAVLTAKLISKMGAVTCVFGLSAIATNTIGNLGSSGGDKLVSLLIAGALFELVLFLTKGSDTISLLFAGSLAAASVPVSGSLLVSISFLQENIYNVFNLAIISLLGGIAGAGIGAWLWSQVRVTKFALGFMETLKE